MNRHVIALGLAAVAAFGFGSPARAGDFLAEAVAQQRARQWVAAEKAYRKAADAEPGVDSLVALGRYLVYMAKPAEALPVFRKALAMDSAHPDALAGEAESLGDLGRYGPAMDACEKALDRLEGAKGIMRKQLARFHLLLAGAQGQAAQNEGVIAMIKYAFSVKKHIDKALEIEPLAARLN